MKYGSGAALNQYKQVNNQGSITDADPHKLIQMLMQGLIDRGNEAKGAIEREDVEAKGLLLSKAIGIIGGLREALNKEKGGEVAENLDRLYDYMQRRLIEANLHSSTKFIDEVISLMKEVKSSWDEIPQEFRAQPAANSEPEQPKE